MFRRIIFFLIILSVSACKKDNNRPQWDMEVIGPLLKATIGMSELIGDSNIIALPGGEQILNYDTAFSGFEIDSIYEIKDTTIQTLQLFPAFPATIPNNFVFYSDTNSIALGLGDLSLKKAIIASGKIRFQISNTLKSKIIYTYTIPGAIKNNQPFAVSFTVDSGSVSTPQQLTSEFDFSGYELNLTGKNGNTTNSITYVVKAQTNPTGQPFNVVPSEKMIDLATTLVDIRPSFVSGYLGRADVDEIRIDNIGIGGLIKNGAILMDSVQMNFDIYNYIGADAQARISSMQSVNNRTGTTVDLTAASVIGQYLNINRAYINSALTDSLVPSIYSIRLDHTNSNIKAMLENIPDKIQYDIDLNLNPLGNVSGSNDFVFSNKLLDTRLNIRMPLSFALNQLVLADTLPFSISNATNFDPVGPLNLSLIADNGFPFEMNIQLFLLDSMGGITDSILVPDRIYSAPYDATYKATGTTRTVIGIPVNENRKKLLLNVKNVGVRLQFNSPDYPQLIQFYTNYSLDLKLTADGIYSIR